MLERAVDDDPLEAGGLGEVGIVVDLIEVAGARRPVDELLRAGDELQLDLLADGRRPRSRSGVLGSRWSYVSSCVSLLLGRLSPTTKGRGPDRVVPNLHLECGIHGAIDGALRSPSDDNP